MIAALGPCTPAFERGAEIVDSKLRPEPRAPEQRCDGNRAKREDLQCVGYTERWWRVRC